MTLSRCSWCTQDQLYIDYHDNEWGVPLFDERQLFEFLNLEAMQAGLNWLTILKKRINYQSSFDQFNPEKIAHYNEKKINTLMQNTGIIRHAKKIDAIIQNAKAFLLFKEKNDSFSDYLWEFVEGKPIKNAYKTLIEVPSQTIISDKMAKELKKLGFKFLGPTTCYAFMQAVGMTNDHLTSCFKY